LRHLSSALACGLVAACAAPEPAPGTAGTASAVGAAAPTTSAAAAQTYADDLMTYLARLRTMNDAALGAEAARMKRDASDVGRVKAALAMTLSSQVDDGDILELLDPVTRKPGASEVRAMAALLHTMANERRRLRQRAAAAAGELREERKVAEAQKQRAEQLQQKLDALTDLERSLAARETQPR
jgi:hypothetical protein